MKMTLCYWLLALGLTACSSSPTKQTPPDATQAVRQEYQRAVELQNKNSQRALQILTDIIKNHSGSSLADRSALLMGDIFVKSERFTEAVRSYEWILNWGFQSPVEAEARIKLSSLYIKGAQSQKALETLRPALSDESLSEELKIQAWDLYAESLSQTTTDRVQLVKTFHQLSQSHPVATERDRYSLRTLEIIESQLNEEEIAQVARDRSLGYSRVPALFQHGMNLFEQGDFGRAATFLNEVGSLAPSSQYAEMAQEVIGQIQARRRVEPKTIGLVVPLSGPMARVGERALHGAQLALQTFGGTDSGYTLAVVDSEGNPDAARRAVEKLVQEDHAVAIIGSLLSKTAPAVSSKSNELGIPNIALSQRAGLTEIGPFIFRNALTSEMQVRHLVRVAMEEKGMKRFALLFPNDPYGIEYANLFWDEVLSRGGTIAGAQSYPPGSTDFDEPVKKLVGTFYLEDRMPEYRHLLSQWNERNPSRSARNQPPKDLLPPIVDFEGIFIPDTPRALGQIAPTLAYNGVSEVTLVGTNLWNHDDLLRRGDRHVEGALFVDSFLQTDPRYVGSQFYQTFQQTFGYAPGIFEVLAFDATLAVKQLLDQGVRSRNELAQRLSRIDYFEGSFDRLQLTEAREFERPLISLTVRNKSIQPLEGSQH